jgi:ketosteroid isomerase-like protein
MPPTSTMQTLRMLLLALAVLLVGSGTGSAQQSDADQVKAALAALQAAIGSLDMAKMEPLWVPDANIMLINPRAKAVSIGWDQAKKNWQAVFDVWSELKVTSKDGPHVSVSGNVAWATTIANVVGKMKSGAAVDSPTFESDVLEKRDGRWLLVSHSAWRVPQ